MDTFIEDRYAIPDVSYRIFINVLRFVLDIAAQLFHKTYLDKYSQLHYKCDVSD